MVSELKRITFDVSPEMEESINSVKRKMFYHYSDSDIIRELLLAGLRAAKIENATREKKSIKSGFSEKPNRTGE